MYYNFSLFFHIWVSASFFKASCLSFWAEVRCHWLFKWPPRSALGWPQTELSSSQSDASSTGPVLRFPGPPVIHNMLMTLTLLITTGQPNLKPCGGRRQRPRPPQHNICQRESADSRMIDCVLLFARKKPTQRGCETANTLLRVCTMTISVE